MEPRGQAGSPGDELGGLAGKALVGSKHEPLSSCVSCTETSDSCCQLHSGVSDTRRGRNKNRTKETLQGVNFTEE